MPPADKAHQNEFLIPFLMIRRYDRKPTPVPLNLFGPINFNHQLFYKPIIFMDTRNSISNDTLISFLSSEIYLYL